MAASNEPNPQHAATDSPWHAAYPTPKNESPETITRQDILGLLRAAENPQKDFVLIDLRRTDHKVVWLHITQAEVSNHRRGEMAK